MDVEIISEVGTLIVYLSGELDHHATKEIRNRIDLAISVHKPDELILDFEKIIFMDSSGIGLVMGRFKKMQETGGNVVIRNPSPHIRKVLKISGIDRLAKITV